MTRPNESQCRRIWEAFASLPRLRLLRLLRNRELCVQDFRRLLNWPQSTTSRHLLYLERAGLIRSRKDGLWRYYALRPPRTVLERKLWEAVEEGLNDVPAFAADRRNRRALSGSMVDGRRPYSQGRPR